MDNKFIKETKLKLEVDLNKKSPFEELNVGIVFEDIPNPYLHEPSLFSLGNLNIKNISASDVQYGGRYGTSISIADKLHWRLILLSRLSKIILNKSYSVPELILGFTETTVGRHISDDFVLVEDSKKDEDFLKLSASMKRVVLSLDSGHPDFDENEIEEFTLQNEYDLSELTFNIVPAIRLFLLAMFEPKLLKFSEYQLLALTFSELTDTKQFRYAPMFNEIVQGDDQFDNIILDYEKDLALAFSEVEIDWGKAVKTAKDGLSKEYIKKLKDTGVYSQPFISKLRNNFSLMKAWNKAVLKNADEFGHSREHISLGLNAVQIVSRNSGKIELSRKERGLFKSAKQSLMKGFNQGWIESDLKDMRKDLVKKSGKKKDK